MSTLCVALLALGLSSAGRDPADDLDRGVREVQEGDLEKGLLTLDTVIQRLEADPTPPAKELSRACAYKGIALVGLGQEEAAKAAFRDALRYDPALRLKKDEHPDRVVRVFEAARTGKKKSVMQRPSGAPKKAGLGAGAIAAIAGGVVLAAGGAALALHDDGGTIPGANDVEIQLTGSAPPFGSTISLADALRREISAPPIISIVVTSRVGLAHGYIDATLNVGATPCLRGNSGAAPIPAGGSNGYPVGFWEAITLSGACTPPFTVDSLGVSFVAAGNDQYNYSGVTTAAFGAVRYRFVP